MSCLSSDITRETIKEFSRVCQNDLAKKKKKIRSKHKKKEKQDKNDLRIKNEVGEEEQENQVASVDDRYEKLASGPNFWECKEPVISNLKTKKGKYNKEIKSQLKLGGIKYKKGGDFSHTTTSGLLMKMSYETSKINVDLAKGYETDKESFERSKKEKKRKFPHKGQRFQIENLEESSEKDKEYERRKDYCRQAEGSYRRTENPEEKRDKNNEKVKNFPKLRSDFRQLSEIFESGSEDDTAIKSQPCLKESGGSVPKYKKENIVKENHLETLEGKKNKTSTLNGKSCLKETRDSSVICKKKKKHFKGKRMNTGESFVKSRKTNIKIHKEGQTDEVGCTNNVGGISEILNSESFFKGLVKSCSLDLKTKKQVSEEKEQENQVSQISYGTNKRNDELPHQKKRKILPKDQSFQVDKLEKSAKKFKEYKSRKDYKQAEGSNWRSENPKGNRVMIDEKLKNSAEQRLNFSCFPERFESGCEDRRRKVSLIENLSIPKNSVSVSSQDSFKFEQSDLSKTICYETSSSEDGTDFRDSLLESKESGSEVYQDTTDKSSNDSIIAVREEMKTSDDNLCCDIHGNSDSEIGESKFTDAMPSLNQFSINTDGKVDPTTVIIKPKPIKLKKSSSYSYLKSENSRTSSHVHPQVSRYQISGAIVSVISDCIPVYKDGDAIYGLFPIPLKVSDDDEKIIMTRVFNNSNPRSDPIFDKQYLFTKFNVHNMESH